ncbi:TetR/AcrR family transcriptional regulator [Amycolatopsis cihanbeyliensis]|uniref:TetR family transcriptional regulator n=1 Tax=Amycolatopsis cihanbeyliensis TaxID=1128664 RepID=A0A542DD25_AMYCI|nr:TetR/AcrR family transcriptional regulator [Amycolatopsis cihanbeyliensis]TQJ00973.1 TetR family transcriptional regulator [Amycolatopsis cihanbeyliensis]
MTATTGSGRKRRAYAPRVPVEQRRTELLDAALHLVVTRGHPAATMDAVAEQAGVTKPVVYGVFTGRAELLATLLRREQGQALRQLRALLPARLDQRLAEDPGALITEVLEEFLRAVREAPNRWYCVVMPMPDMPTELHRAREHARNLALRGAEGIARRLLRTVDAPPGLAPDILAHTVVTLFETAARLVLTEPDRFRPERFGAAIRAAIELADRP